MRSKNDQFLERNQHLNLSVHPPKCVVGLSKLDKSNFFKKKGEGYEGPPPSQSSH